MVWSVVLVIVVLVVLVLVLVVLNKHLMLCGLIWSAVADEPDSGVVVVSPLVLVHLLLWSGISLYLWYVVLW